jgi:hypothetical protein
MLTFASEAGVNLTEAPFKGAPLKGMLLARDKCSSLLQKFVNYGCRRFYNIGPSGATLDGWIKDFL